MVGVVWNGLEVDVHPFDQDYKYIQLYRLIDCFAITIVVLNRPNKRNAINSCMWKEIGHVFKRLGTTGDDCRVVLLAANGVAFCAGIDITDTSFLSTTTIFDDEEEEEGENDENETSYDPIRIGIASFLPKLYEMQQCFTAVEQCKVPVICAIQDGWCVGAGIDLICCTDIRICSIQTMFAIKEVQVGMTPDVGTIQRFPKLVGNQSAVHELCYTGRMFTSQEAYEIGLVSRICSNQKELLAECIQLCIQIANNSPIAVYGTKQSLLYSRDHSVLDGLQHVGMYNALAFQQGQDITKAFQLHPNNNTKVPTFTKIPKYSKL